MMIAPEKIWIDPAWANTFATTCGGDLEVVYIRADLAPTLPSADYVRGVEAAVLKHLTWFERFICDRDELDSSTPRKVADNAKDAAIELRLALADRPDQPAADTRVVTPQEAAEVLWNSLTVVSDACEKLVKVYKFNAVLQRIIIGEPGK